MEKAISCTRIPVTEIEKEAIRAAAVEHNKELPLIVHQLTNGENVDRSIRSLYSTMDSSRARRRVYDFLQREVKKAAYAKLIQHTPHIDPHAYMVSNEKRSRSLQIRGNSRGCRGHARRGCTRQGSMIDLGPLNDNMIVNNNENNENVEQYEVQRAGGDDEEQWDDEETFGEEQSEPPELTFDHYSNQSEEEEEMLVDQCNESLQHQRSATTTNVMSESQVVVDKMFGQVVDNTRRNFNSQSTIFTSGPVTASFDSSLQNQRNTGASRTRPLSVEFDTPPTLNRCLNAGNSNPRPSGTNSSINSRQLNVRGRGLRRRSELNQRQRHDSTASTRYDATGPVNHENSNEDDQETEEEPRRSLTRVLMDTADSLKEAARMAVQACDLAMKKINEL